MDESAGTRVIRAAVAAASEVLGDNLVAAYALGSLAHGGFAPLVSDIDIALVLGEISADTGADIDKIGRLVRQQHPGALAERLSIFWADWEGVWHGPSEFGRLPVVDRLDLIESGHLLHGIDKRNQATLPSARDLMINAAEFALTKFDGEYLADVRQPDRLLAQGARATTKTVLFPVRFLYTLDTRRIGQNDEAASWYCETGAASALARAALVWRHWGIDAPERAATLLSKHLMTVYLEFFDACIAALATDGRSDLAAALEQRREQLLRLTDP